MLLLTFFCALFLAGAISLCSAGRPDELAGGQAQAPSPGRRRRIALTAGSLSLIFLLLSITWFVSDQFTGEGFNSAVIYHLRIGLEGGGTLEYLGLLIATVLLIALAVGVSFWFASKLLQNPAQTGNSRAYPLLLCLGVLCLIHPTSNAFLGSFNSALYGPDSALGRLLFEDVPLDSVARRFDDYYVLPSLSSLPSRPSRPSLPAVKPQKNLVLLYAESLERTYFDEALFPGLITELRALESEAISFTGIRQVRGTGFTIAGLVASQCGTPLITSGHPNSMRGMADFLPGATCIGDVLKTQDYTLHYLGGAQLSFAGKGSFFETHGFDSVEGLKELRPTLDDPDYVSTWGLYDDSLLEMLHQRFEVLSQGSASFGLVGLTMDTHHPHGHQSRSCEGLIYGDGSNSMLNAVKCADRLIARFIRQLRSSPWAKDTVLVLASDHLALKNDSYEQLQQGERHNLLWVFPGDDARPRQIAAPGTTLDTAATLMYALGLGGEAFGLGRNLLAGDASLITTMNRFPWQLREWRADIAEFWQLPSSMEVLQVNPQEMSLQIDGRRYAAPALLTLEDGAVAEIRFEFDSQIKLPSYVSGAGIDQTLLWIDDCQRVRAMALSLPKTGVCLFAGRPGSRAIKTQQLTTETELSAAELRALAAQPLSDAVFASRQRSLKSLRDFGEADLRRGELPTGMNPGLAELEVFSATGPRSQSYVSLGEQRVDLTRGLNIVRIGESDIERLASFDACASELPQDVTLKAFLEEESANPSILLVVAHDSATCGNVLDGFFAGSGLERWRELGVRQPYAAAYLEPSTGRPDLEILGDRLASILIRQKERAL